jgi:hypothetical protein
MKKAHLFRTGALAGVAVLVGGVLVAGCAKDGDQGRLVSANAADMKQRSDAEMQRIQNDPKMSPTAKAMALRGMQQAEQNAQAAQAVRAKTVR